MASELSSSRFFKKDGLQVLLKTVSYSKDPIQSMGGMTIVPDCLIAYVVVSEKNILPQSRKSLKD
ncbi:hypothetical protein JZO77_17445 [Enterococcus hulanensis]|uniref:hypothetical protein n=1 Tax=Enterococcus hulanensis TaxID=2559929 RepID=UPI001A8EC174|nr:hypothetical protein [Enterococcus hulanensis]MBO0458521.1 hypothetical protein [Enterococcus hulanensis]